MWRIHTLQFIPLKKTFIRSALFDLILQIIGSPVAMKIPQYGDICHVVSSCLDSQRSVVLLEVFLGEYDYELC